MGGAAGSNNDYNKGVYLSTIMYKIINKRLVLFHFVKDGGRRKTIIIVSKFNDLC
jgi:hypothetical protein